MKKAAFATEAVPSGTSSAAMTKMTIPDASKSSALPVKRKAVGTFSDPVFIDGLVPLVAYRLAPLTAPAIKKTRTIGGSNNANNGTDAKSTAAPSKVDHRCNLVPHCGFSQTNTLTANGAPVATTTAANKDGINKQTFVFPQLQQQQQQQEQPRIIPISIPLRQTQAPPISIPLRQAQAPPVEASTPTDACIMMQQQDRLQKLTSPTDLWMMQQHVQQQKRQLLLQHQMLQQQQLQHQMVQQRQEHLRQQKQQLQHQMLQQQKLQRHIRIQDQLVRQATAIRMLVQPQQHQMATSQMQVGVKDVDSPAAATHQQPNLSQMSPKPTGRTTSNNADGGAVNNNNTKGKQGILPSRKMATVQQVEAATPSTTANPLSPPLKATDAAFNTAGVEEGEHLGTRFTTPPNWDSTGSELPTTAARVTKQPAANDGCSGDVKGDVAPGGGNGTPFRGMWHSVKDTCIVM